MTPAGGGGRAVGVQRKGHQRAGRTLCRRIRVDRRDLVCGLAQRGSRREAHKSQDDESRPPTSATIPRRTRRDCGVQSTRSGFDLCPHDFLPLTGDGRTLHGVHDAGTVHARLDPGRRHSNRILGISQHWGEICDQNWVVRRGAGRTWLASKAAAGGIMIFGAPAPAWDSDAGNRGQQARAARGQGLLRAALRVVDLSRKHPQHSCGRVRIGRRARFTVSARCARMRGRWKSGLARPKYAV